MEVGVPALRIPRRKQGEAPRGPHKGTGGAAAAGMEPILRISSADHEDEPGDGREVGINRD